MAEKKKKKLMSSSTGKESSGADIKPATYKKAESAGSATGYRIGAAALWVVAIALEVLAILLLVGKLNWTFMNTLTLVIILLVLDLVCVIIGAQLWKKSNKIDPASEANKLKFWLWNNMGLIVCAFAFIPFVILALTNKEADKKTKAIATVVAIIALLIGGLASYDWNPISEEQKEAAVAEIEGTVYWTTFGKVYHTHKDCQALNQSDSLIYGPVKDAIEADRTRLCAFCAKKDNIEGVFTDKNPDDVELEEE